MQCSIYNDFLHFKYGASTHFKSTLWKNCFLPRWNIGLKWIKHIPKENHHNKTWLFFYENRHGEHFFHTYLKFEASFWINRSRRPECSAKTVFLEILQNLQENTCARDVLIKLQVEVCNFIEKETLAQVFSREFFEVSKNNFFRKTPPMSASELLKKMLLQAFSDTANWICNI